MDWFFLLMAGIFEMFGVSSIHKLHKERNRQSLLLLCLCFGLSFLFLAIAMKTLDMGTAYAIWTGIGTAGGVLLGMVVHGESRNVPRIIALVVVVGAAVGLKMIA